MYVTVEDIRKALSEDVLIYLVDDERERSITPAGLERIADKIRDTNGEVDSYIAQRYTLPLPEVPDMLRSKAKDICIYKLFLRRGIRQNSADESVVMANNDAIKFLDKVARGTVTLTLPTNSETIKTPSDNKPRITAPPRIFSRETLDDF